MTGAVSRDTGVVRRSYAWRSVTSERYIVTNCKRRQWQTSVHLNRWSLWHDPEYFHPISNRERGAGACRSGGSPRQWKCPFRMFSEKQNPHRDWWSLVIVVHLRWMQLSEIETACWRKILRKRKESAELSSCKLDDLFQQCLEYESSGPSFLAIQCRQVVRWAKVST